MKHLALHAFIHGHVQGVFFRDSTLQEAKVLEITGWVRNRLDGRVEVMAYGTTAQLDALKTWLHSGPKTATVTQVDAHMLEDQPEPPSDFTVLPTE